MAKKTGVSGDSRGPNQMMMRRTLVLMLACGIVAFIVLAARLFYLQVLKHDWYENAAIEQQVRDTTIAADRGTIYDRNMKILAMSASVDTIYISPAEINMYKEDITLIASGLSEILGVDYAKIIELGADTNSYYKIVARKVEQEQSDKVREFKNEHDLKGIKLEVDTKRYYPYSSLASHVIGFVGTENKGHGGIELYYDSTLTGVNGRVVRAKNSYGTDMLFTKFEDYYDAQDGNDIVLAIDSTIQYYLEKHLEQAVLDYDVQNGAAAIAMDVNTGGILGMVSLGNFDLNDYQAVSDEVMTEIEELEDEKEKSDRLAAEQQLQWRNKVLSDTYEPGSTFKIITLAMALEEGVATESEAFYCGGSRAVLGRNADNPVNCWKTIGHGAQTLVSAVQHSCNVAFVDLGLRVGTEKFYEYAEAFGFFDYSGKDDVQLSGKTGIDLSGESGSIWWPRNTFCDEDNLSQLAAASFGQTFNITPIQLITAVSACVNGGYLMQPYIVDEVIDNAGVTVSKTEPNRIRQVISEETSKRVCDILEQVVGDPVEGTGKTAYVAGYRVGGKTGTSTNTVVEAQTGTKEYIVSFVAIAPTDDPQIAILVLLDSPSKETGLYISGGQMAAPTVGKMLTDILPYLGIEAQYTDGEMETMDKTVPNVTELSLAEAEAMLKQCGLDSRVMGSGTMVTAQLPAANAVVAAGSQVILYADSAPSDGGAVMPDISNMSYTVARQHLAYHGLFLKSSGGSITDPDTMIVIKQSIEAGAEVEYGTIVEVDLQSNDQSMYGRY